MGKAARHCLPVAALLACALAALPGRRAAAQPVGGVRGTVVEARSGTPLPGLEVLVEAAPGRAGSFVPRSATTDSAGRFAFPAIPPGPVVLRTRALGFTPTATAVTIADTMVDVTIAVSSVAVTLETVRAEARAWERERFESRPNVGTIRVTRSSMSSVPAVGEPDVLRTVQLLPGVTARNDFTAGFNVRGGEADQNLVLLDGYPIYNPFHLGGLFGTFIDETVGDIQLHTGGFSAQYGGRLSSVLDVRSARTSRPGVHGTAGLSLLSSHAVVAQALDNGRAGWVFGVRRTYADKLASLFTSQSLPYHFADAQLHAWRQLGNGRELALTAYAGHDLLDGDFAHIGDSTESGGGRFRFDWGNRVVGLTYAAMLRALGDSGRIQLRASDSRFSTGLDLGSGSLLLDNHASEQRAEAVLRGGSRSLEWRTGVTASRYRTTYSAESQQAGSELFAIDQRPEAGGAFGDLLWRAGTRLILQGGARAEGVSGTGWRGVSPRASAKLFVTPDLAVTFAAGRYAQWMHSLAREDIPVRIFDFWITSDSSIAVSRAVHLVAGVESWLSSTRFVRVEAYHKRYPHLLDANPTNDPTRRGDEFFPETGTSWGIDLMAQQLEAGRLAGWIAYSYAVAKRTTGALHYYPGHDRRHNLNVVASWRTDRGWVIGSRFGLGTGTPFTDIVAQLVRRNYDPGTNGWDTGVNSRAVEAVGGPRNGARLPLFQRLDASVTRRVPWRGMILVPYFSVVNVYNARNVFTYTFDYTTSPPTRSSLSQFPILPALGMSVEF